MARQMKPQSLLALAFVGLWACSQGPGASPGTPVDTSIADSGADGDGGGVSKDVSSPVDSVNGSTDGGGKDSAANDTAAVDKDSRGPAPVCTPGVIQPLGEDFFSDISDASGIRVDNVILGSSKAIPINDHSRLGFVDINGDGLDDIVTHSLFPNPQKGIPFEHLIYRNNGDGTFAHVSDQSGLRKIQSGFLAFGDVDNDGDQDCFAGLDIPIIGKTHLLLLNDGKGVFTVKVGSGVEAVPPYAANAVFADFNGDAALDLFVGMGHTTFKAPNYLLMGKGDGTFSDKTSQLGDNAKQPTNGSLACDYDNDGDLDIFVSNYGVSVAAGHNKLHNNDGKGNFVEVGVQTGFAYQTTGNSWLAAKGIIKGDEPNPGPVGFIGSNGFGMDCGDINGDGMLDIFATAISHPNATNYSRTWSDPTQVLINKPGTEGVKFNNEATSRNLAFNEGDVDGALVDVDNDGRLDLSRSRDKKYEKAYTTIEQKAWFGIAHQQSDGSFVAVGPTSGINGLDYKKAASLTPCTGDAACSNGEKCLLKACRLPCATNAQCKGAEEICHSGGFCKGLVRMKSAQNHAWSDVDSDGDMDLLVGGRDTGGGRPNFLFRNDVGNKLPWLQVRLVGDGDKVNRDAIGGRATLVFTNGVGLLREVKSSRGMHNSMDSRWLHFGLGDNGCDYTLNVRWPDGNTAQFKAAELPAKAHYTITYPDKLAIWTKP